VGGAGVTARDKVRVILSADDGYAVYRVQRRFLLVWWSVATYDGIEEAISHANDTVRGVRRKRGPEVVWP
jgi:hypothetical protein